MCDLIDVLRLLEQEKSAEKVFAVVTKTTENAQTCQGGSRKKPCPDLFEQLQTQEERPRPHVIHSFQEKKDAQSIVIPKSAFVQKDNGVVMYPQMLTKEPLVDYITDYITAETSRHVEGDRGDLAEKAGREGAQAAGRLHCSWRGVQICGD